MSAEGAEGRSELNARLRELGEQTPYPHSEWVSAAMWLGDNAEALLPTLEDLVRVGPWRPLAAAQNLGAALRPTPEASR